MCIFGPWSKSVRREGEAPHGHNKKKLARVLGFFLAGPSEKKKNSFVVANVDISLKMLPLANLFGAANRRPSAAAAWSYWGTLPSGHFWVFNEKWMNGFFFIRRWGDLAAVPRGVLCVCIDIFYKRKCIVAQGDATRVSHSWRSTSCARIKLIFLSVDSLGLQSTSAIFQFFFFKIVKHFKPNERPCSLRYLAWSFA